MKQNCLIPQFAVLIFLVFANLAYCQSENAKSESALTAQGYQTQKIEGWTVLVSEKLAKETPEKTALAIELLQSQLADVKKVLPEKALEKLVNVPIWLSPQYPGTNPGGAYHPSKRWLVQNGRNPKLARCIEFTNVGIFKQEIKRMPVMVLHELAHAYHDQVLGFDNSIVEREYQRAVKEGIYDSVFRPSSNRNERAYALTNAKEYFAETSEAFFGKNDFFPFTKDQLKQHDPHMHSILSKLWDIN
jgi:hypothetical protein